MVRGFQANELRLSTEEVEEAFTVKLSQLADPSCHGYTQFRFQVKKAFAAGKSVP